VWPSMEQAARLYDLANWGLIVGLVIGVISTVLLVWMGSVKEADAKAAQQRFEMELEKQRERAANAERQLLQGQLPRQVDFQKLTAALKGKPPSAMEIWFQPYDPEAYHFALQLYGALSSDGWHGPTPKPLPITDAKAIERFSPLVEKDVGLVGTGILQKGLLPLQKRGGTPVGNLVEALSHMGLAPYSTIRITVPDAPLPEGLVVILVGQKE